MTVLFGLTFVIHWENIHPECLGVFIAVAVVGRHLRLLSQNGSIKTQKEACIYLTL